MHRYQLPSRICPLSVARKTPAASISTDICPIEFLRYCNAIVALRFIRLPQTFRPLAGTPALRSAIYCRFAFRRAVGCIRRSVAANAARTVSATKTERLIRNRRLETCFWMTHLAMVIDSKLCAQKKINSFSYLALTCLQRYSH